MPSPRGWATPGGASEPLQNNACQIVTNTLTPDCGTDPKTPPVLGRHGASGTPSIRKRAQASEYHKKREIRENPSHPQVDYAIGDKGLDNAANSPPDPLLQSGLGLNQAEERHDAFLQVRRLPHLPRKRHRLAASTKRKCKRAMRIPCRGSGCEQCLIRANVILERTDLVRNWIPDLHQADAPS